MVNHQIIDFSSEDSVKKMHSKSICIIYSIKKQSHPLSDNPHENACTSEVSRAQNKLSVWNGGSSTLRQPLG